MRLLGLLVPMSLFSACVDESPNESVVSQDVIVANGVSLNGVSLNGVSLNGVSLNGVSLNGVSLSGVGLTGVTTIASTGTTSQPLTGAGVVGTTWTATLSNGALLPLRIDSAITGTGSNSDVWMYGVSYRTGAVWSPLCGVDLSNAPILAVTLPGIWDTHAGTPGGGSHLNGTGQFTFACRAKTIAKCVELGYKPWTGHADLLQSCTRLLRADFCGDGTPHTLDGQTLDIYDNAGIQADTQSWVPEAEWNAAGATCMTTKGETRFQYLGLPVPLCVKLREAAACGIMFHSSSLLIDELPQSVQ